MSAGRVRISALVSAETRALLEQVTEASGLSEGEVLEEALLLYLDAVRALPSDVPIPGRLVLSGASAQRVAEVLASPRAPNGAMRALVAGEAGDDIPC